MTNLIRHATIRDVDEIARVHRDSWKAAHSHLVAPAKMATITDDEWDRNWRDRLSRAETAESTVIAVEDGHIVGVSFWQPAQDEDLDPQRVAELTVLYVTPSAWRSGVGRSLLNATLRQMRDARFPQAVLWVLEGNDRAIHFYEATGWRRQSRVAEFKDFGAPALRYQRPL